MREVSTCDLRQANGFLRQFPASERSHVRRFFASGIGIKSTPSGLVDHALLCAANALAHPMELNGARLAAAKRLRLVASRNMFDVLDFAASHLMDGGNR